jgi:hypothetical protein
MTRQLQAVARRFGWEAREIRGAAIESRGQTITPIALRARVQWPGGGFVWTHPRAVEVTRDGVTQRIPIPDSTLAILLSLPLAGLGCVALAAAWIRRRRTFTGEVPHE